MIPTASPVPKPSPHRPNGLLATSERRVWVYLAGCAAAVVVAWALGFVLTPEDMGQELGPIQLAQAAVLVAAAAGLLFRLHADGVAHRLGPLWVTMAAVAGWLAWRELEIDKHLFDLHAFSWRYLARDVPLLHKVVFGTFSIGSLALFAWYVHRHRRRIIAGVRQRWPRLPVALAVAGVSTLVVAQLWDQSVLLVSAFKTATLEPLPEELLELAGEFLLLSAVMEINVLARLRHPALADAAPQR